MAIACQGLKTGRVSRLAVWVRVMVSKDGDVVGLTSILNPGQLVFHFPVGIMFLVLWHCCVGDRKGIWRVKICASYTKNSYLALVHWRKRHTLTFNGPLSGTARVSRYQKGKNQSGFYWSKRQWVAVASAGPICKSPPRSRQITTPVPHHSVFYRPDALPAAQPTASKHWRHKHWKHWRKRING